SPSPGSWNGDGSLSACANTSLNGLNAGSTRGDPIALIRFAGFFINRLTILGVADDLRNDLQSRAAVFLGAVDFVAELTASDLHGIRLVVGMRERPTPERRRHREQSDEAWKNRSQTPTLSHAPSLDTRTLHA